MSKILVVLGLAVVMMLIAFAALSVNLFFKRSARLKGCSSKEGGCCSSSSCATEAGS